MTGPEFEIQTYVDERDEHRWRVVARNNRIVAESGEGYTNRQDMLDILKRLFPRDEPPEYDDL